MAKRYKFTCWNCNRDYTLQREVDSSIHILNVACPYCGQEGVVNLKPRRHVRLRMATHKASAQS